MAPDKLVTAMKAASLFLSCLTSALAAAGLGEVKTIYLLPMAHGLDQHLASRLTSGGAFTVIADPQAADAVITDRLGEAFENRLDELYPPAAPAAKPEAPEKQEKGAAGDAGAAVERGERVGGMSTFGRGRGTVFVVDRKTRRVLWSIYAPPKDFTSQEVDRTAARIAGAMAKTALKK
jgi:hypothetical protein